MKNLTKKINAEHVWYALPALIGIGFFVWVLMEMGAQSSGVTLIRLLVGVAVVLGGGALVYWLTQKADDEDYEGS